MEGDWQGVKRSRDGKAERATGLQVGNGHQRPEFELFQKVSVNGLEEMNKPVTRKSGCGPRWSQEKVLSLLCTQEKPWIKEQ